MNQQEIRNRIATLESERQGVIRECKARNEWCKKSGIKDPSRDKEVARLSMLSHSIHSDISFLKGQLVDK
ncbi:MAG: hypothetical protein OXN25_01555 [Candidatus Poribacteria bacterium]|nr:hypothetical protein [Candidatus Poribacteria bacterium]